ncbi:O-antigen ligase family protein [Bradyrhizobium sp. CCBAU 51627]|uniref:O-antigen ligase family protein n=1 Tax=Bradyrhizobium sp. CCBAU 51627 TaxID=1325088 RepID=UPI002306D12B|nr:O-antigen ligase family protein [Bradyrhizobium sp. CCBAU 51627]
MYKTSRFAAIGVFVLAPLPFGSAETVWICIWTVLLAFSLITADLRSATVDDFRLLSPLFVVLVVVAAVITMQLWPNPAFHQGDPAWAAARAVTSRDLPDRVSVTANGPWLAFGYPLLFALAFTRAAYIATNAEHARQLLRILAWAGLGYALYAILAGIGDPTTLLFRRKEAYLGFVTGTFVNRNTAATFFGTCALLFLAPLLRFIYRQDRPARPPSRRMTALIAYYLASPFALAGGFVVCLVATAMTGSRAGLLLLILTVFLATALFFAPLRVSKFRRWGWIAGTAVALLFLFQLVGGAVAGRILTYGLVDEQRFTAYRAVLMMIQQHPWLGIGYGNFESAFPAYRPDALGSLGVWDRAHSTPLELAVELGIPAACLIMVTCLWYLYQLLNGSLHRRRDRYIPIIGASVATLGFLHTSIDFSLQIPGFGVFFAAITGCGLAQCRSSAEQKSSVIAALPIC